MQVEGPDESETIDVVAMDLREWREATLCPVQTVQRPVRVGHRPGGRLPMRPTMFTSREYHQEQQHAPDSDP